MTISLNIKELQLNMPVSLNIKELQSNMPVSLNITDIQVSTACWVVGTSKIFIDHVLKRLNSKFL